MTAVRRGLVLILVAALVASGCGLVRTASAVAAGGKAKGSASTPAPTSASPSATPTPTVAPGSGLSGFPAPPVVTTPSATPTAVPTNATGTGGAGNLSSSNALIIVIGAVVILLGISFFIWRDARRRAPVRADALPTGEGRSKPGSRAAPKPRKLSPAERRRRKRGRAKR